MLLWSAVRSEVLTCPREQTETCNPPICGQGVLSPVVWSLHAAAYLLRTSFISDSGTAHPRVCLHDVELAALSGTGC